MLSELRTQIPPRLLEALAEAPLMREDEITKVNLRKIGPARKFAGHWLAPPATSVAGSRLTRGEWYALACAAAGHGPASASERAGLPYETVLYNLKRARRKLRARNTTHAVAVAYRQHIL